MLSGTPRTLPRIAIALGSMFFAYPEMAFAVTPFEAEIVQECKSAAQQTPTDHLTACINAAIDAEPLRKRSARFSNSPLETGFNHYFVVRLMTAWSQDRFYACANARVDLRRDLRDLQKLFKDSGVTGAPTVPDRCDELASVIEKVTGIAPRWHGCARNSSAYDPLEAGICLGRSFGRPEEIEAIAQVSRRLRGGETKHLPGLEFMTAASRRTKYSRGRRDRLRQQLADCRANQQKRDFRLGYGPFRQLAERPMADRRRPIEIDKELDCTGVQVAAAYVDGKRGDDLESIAQPWRRQARISAAQAAAAKATDIKKRCWRHPDGDPQRRPVDLARPLTRDEANEALWANTRIWCSQEAIEREIARRVAAGEEVPENALRVNMLARLFGTSLWQPDQKQPGVCRYGAVGEIHLKPRVTSIRDCQGADKKTCQISFVFDCNGPDNVREAVCTMAKLTRPMRLVARYNSANCEWRATTWSPID